MHGPVIRGAELSAWGFLPVAGSPMANRFSAQGQTKLGLKTPMTTIKSGLCFPLPSGAQRQKRLVARPAPVARGPADSPSLELLTCKRGHRGQVQFELVEAEGRELWRSHLQLQKLALGMWNITFLAGETDRDGAGDREARTRHHRGRLNRQLGLSWYQSSRGPGLFSTRGCPR